jgi:GTPase SAR1 family protein
MCAGEYFAKYHKIKFIETSAIDGTNVEEAFQTIARDIYTRIEKGELKVQDGWDGVKNGLMQRSNSTVSLDSSSQYNQSDSTCAYC